MEPNMEVSREQNVILYNSLVLQDQRVQTRKDWGEVVRQKEARVWTALLCYGAYI